MNAMQQTRRKNKQTKKLDAIFSFISDVFIILGIVLLLQQHIFSVGRVHGVSMDTTLIEGQKLVVDRISYKLSTPQRFDIVAVKFPSQDAYWVKRIIGLPGERVEYANNVLYINGRTFDEPFLDAGIKTNDFSTDAFFPATNGVLPADRYLVLGDNRSNSRDGRQLGTLTKSDILGVARLSIYPLDRLGFLEVKIDSREEEVV